MTTRNKNSAENTDKKIPLNDFVLPLFQAKKPMTDIINQVARQVEKTIEDSVTFPNFTTKIVESQKDLGYLLDDQSIKDKLSALKEASKIPSNNYNLLLTFVNDFCSEFYIVNKHNEPQTSKVQKILKVIGINPEKGKTQTKTNKTTLCIDILMDNLHCESEFKADVLLRQTKPSGKKFVEVDTPQKIRAYEQLKDIIHYAVMIENRLPDGMKLADIFKGKKQG